MPPDAPSQMMRKLKNLVLGFAASSISASATASDQPNIVYIVVDNWGWGDISIQGSTVQT